MEIQQKVFRSGRWAKLYGRRETSMARKMKETEKSRRHFPEKTTCESMPQQLPKIALGGRRNPDSRKPILEQQTE
jgi:hypothetical protein